MSTTRVLPTRRAARVSTDVLAGVWVVAWAPLAWLAKARIDALADPLEKSASTTGDLMRQVDDARSRMAEVPIVGRGLSDSLAPMSGSLGDLTAQATATIESIHTVAWTMFFALWLIPALSVAVPYILSRIRRARELGAARQLLATHADADLFALRALSTLPLVQLVSVTANPVASWRAGDRQVINQLAALEYQRLGIRTTPTRPGTRVG